MGVTGLWQILHPCARPIKLETLNRKRLAVDASIWIYQFLKAVRDKEGHALRNSHVVGFFRRICKLLFFGIKPVFVFDGGAPALKRRTVSERKKRREGRREDAVRTAGKLLAVQMQRRAEEEEEKERKRKEGDQNNEEDEAVPDDLVYVDEIGMSAREKQQTRKFKKKDAYHLPDLDVSMSEMGQPNDPRIMSLEELQNYAKQFESGEDINVYDFSKIDYDSPFFTSLPASDRYNILNAARLRSRLRMGHSKEQLDSMFPDRMAFSKFQIERVRERNELTQRLMHINEGGDTLFNAGGRVAGEKGREYVLVKNDGVEGGWALGVISDEGTTDNPIDLDEPVVTAKKEDEEWEDDEEFEDVPIEGLNRLPKRPKLDDSTVERLTKQRHTLYKSRKSGGKRRAKRTAEPNPLFITDDPEQDLDEDAEWEDLNLNLYPELFGESNTNTNPAPESAAEEGEDEDEELRRAIALSLETNDPDPPSDDEMHGVFQSQTAAPESNPLPKASGRALANIVNKRAFAAAPESREITSFGVPTQKPDSPVNLASEGSDGDEGDTMDFQAALAESRRSKRRPSPPSAPAAPVKKAQAPVQQDTAAEMARRAGFSGPLPFEKLDLGSSLLGKKKMESRAAEAAGGFVNPELEEKKKQQEQLPLPPWFGGDPGVGVERWREEEREERKRERQREMERKAGFLFERKEGPVGLEREEREVIDLDADDEGDGGKEGEVVDLVEDDVEMDDVMNGSAPVDTAVRMGDVAEKVRLEPPVPNEVDVSSTVPVQQTEARRDTESTPKSPLMEEAEKSEDEELFDWSDSEDEREKTSRTASAKANGEVAGAAQRQPPRSPSAEFEDVAIPEEPASKTVSDQDFVDVDDVVDGPTPASGLVHQESLPNDDDLVEFLDDFSDPEDEELLRQLTLEAEEHARFASTLNNKSQAQNIADYEKELRQLRNQQKKDRRDADEVTHIMITECQQLLRLFGLPYVTAPMEAEAQCAELVRSGLVDGIVTDDSDCFLFGGTRIYKNMFNQAKFVECYLTSDLEKEFDLTRNKLIQIAHLLGSDYTEGLQGVGPVTALEILTEFSTLDAFKAWFTGVQTNTIPKSADAGSAFKKKFRKNATKLFLPTSFPDSRVDQAYAAPDVDKDPQPFQWGVPDLDALRSFLMATIGWSQERTDEVLVPVIRDMNRRADEGTQSNITAFFEGGVGVGAAGQKGGNDVFAPRKRVAEKSKRMGKALTSLAERAKRNRESGGGDTSESNDQRGLTDGGDDQPDVETGEEGQPPPKKKQRQAKPKGKASKKKRNRDEDSGSDFEDESQADVPKKRTKTRAAPQAPKAKGKRSTNVALDS